jgi:hypothetical protein
MYCAKAHGAKMDMMIASRKVERRVPCIPGADTCVSMVYPLAYDELSKVRHQSLPVISGLQRANLSPATKGFSRFDLSLLVGSFGIGYRGQTSVRLWQRRGLTLKSWGYSGV